jgi:DNA-binding CsgD family transcriptional regulator
LRPQAVRLRRDRLGKNATRDARSPRAGVTQREREVLALIAEGKSDSAIPDSLVLTKRAVEKDINSIFSKLNTADATQARKRVKATLVFLAEERELDDRTPARRGDLGARTRKKADARTTPISVRASLSRARRCV